MVYGGLQRGKNGNLLFFLKSILKKFFILLWIYFEAKYIYFMDAIVWILLKKE